MPLRIKNFSLSWGDALPDAGGLRNQDARLMNQIEYCLAVYRAVQKQLSFDHETVERMSDAEVDIITSLQKECIMDEIWTYKKNKKRKA